ncbi:MAG: hypothetical protein QOG52_2486, partial [Frankiaceae bacterium]|nr:hypothetical protein [Frankiaceae bacterium]
MEDPSFEPPLTPPAAAPAPHRNRNRSRYGVALA